MDAISKYASLFKTQFGFPGAVTSGLLPAKISALTIINENAQRPQSPGTIYYGPVSEDSNDGTTSEASEPSTAASTNISSSASSDDDETVSKTLESLPEKPLCPKSLQVQHVVLADHPIDPDMPQKSKSAEIAAQKLQPITLHKNDREAVITSTGNTGGGQPQNRQSTSGFANHGFGASNNQAPTGGSANPRPSGGREHNGRGGAGTTFDGTATAAVALPVCKICDGDHSTDVCEPGHQRVFDETTAGFTAFGEAQPTFTAYGTPTEHDSTMERFRVSCAEFDAEQDRLQGLGWSSVTTRLPLVVGSLVTAPAPVNVGAQAAPPAVHAPASRIPWRGLVSDEALVTVLNELMPRGALPLQTEYISQIVRRNGNINIHSSGTASTGKTIGALVAAIDLVIRMSKPDSNGASTLPNWLNVFDQGGFIMQPVVVFLSMQREVSRGLFELAAAIINKRNSIAATALPIPVGQLIGQVEHKTATALIHNKPLIAFVTPGKFFEAANGATRSNGRTRSPYIGFNRLAHVVFDTMEEFDADVKWKAVVEDMRSFKNRPKDLPLRIVTISTDPDLEPYKIFQTAFPDFLMPSITLRQFQSRYANTHEVDSVHHRLQMVNGSFVNERNAALIRCLVDARKYFRAKHDREPRVAVFCNTRHSASAIAAFINAHVELNSGNFPAMSSHGRRLMKDRHFVATKFEAVSRWPVLITTDLYAHGKKLPNVDLVVNYGLPPDVPTYVRRAATVGLSQSGRVVTLLYRHVEAAASADQAALRKAENERVTIENIALALKTHFAELVSFAQSDRERGRLRDMVAMLDQFLLTIPAAVDQANAAGPVAQANAAAPVVRGWGENDDDGW